MQKGALKGIGDVIKAHTTEKSIDELKAQGKKRVRVVSGQRVMEIIQAIVDDTIDREVGEITKRDRDRIVTDTRDRFNRVLKMQTDLEQTVTDLRSELREVDLERERLRADKGFLEQQLDSTRKTSGEPESVTRLGRDIDRLREAVDEIHRHMATADEAAIGRAVERLVGRDEQNARRLAAELDDVRKRIDGVSRETSRAKESSVELLFDRLTEVQRRSEQDLAKRLENEFNGVHERITDLRDRVAASQGSDDALDRLKGDLDALEDRMQGVEVSSTETAERISAAVVAEIVSLRELLGSTQDATEAASADALTAVEQRLSERFSEESAEMRTAVAGLVEQVAAIDDRTGNAVEAVAERVAERVVIDEGALTDAVARVASRVDARIDEITAAIAAADERRTEEVADLRSEILAATADHSGVEAALSSLGDRQDARLDEAVGALGRDVSERHDALLQAVHDGIARLDEQVTSVAERTAAVDVGLPEKLEGVLSSALTAALAGVREDVAALGATASESTASTLSAVEGSLGMLRDEMASVRDELGSITTRAVETESGLRESLRESVSELRAELRTELTSLAAHHAETQRLAAEAAARQDDAIRTLREEVTAAAAAAAASSNERFDEALDKALDKITKTMEYATARPIEIGVEATDVLLDKIFDAGEGELTSNLGQLEIEERQGDGIAGSLGKLRALHTASENGKGD